MASLKSYLVCEQHFRLMHPMARLALGSSAALLAFFAGALLFGPVADDRAMQLAQGHSAPRVAAGASGATLVLASAAMPAASVPGRRK